MTDNAVAHGELSVVVWGQNLGNEEVREFGVDYGALRFAVNTYKELRGADVDSTYRF